jgi:5-methylcytosine-specific restriction endonuclease McrA
MPQMRTSWNKGLKGTPGGRYPKGHNKKFLECLVCGKNFVCYGSELEQSENRRRKYCSNECKYIGVKTSMKGVNEGSKNGNWNNGSTAQTILIRQSSEYKHWRKAVFIRDGYTCQECGQTGGKLTAHHLQPFSLYPELRTNINNGQTLCEECHLKTDTFGINIGKAREKVA